MVSLHWQRLNCWRPVCWQLKNSRSSKKQLLEWRFNRVPLISRSDFSWWYTCDGLCQFWWRGILNISTIFRVVKLPVTITTISVDFNCNIVLYMHVIYRYWMVLVYLQYLIPKLIWNFEMFALLHPGRLTSNLLINHLERKMIFQTSMIMFHVNLPGCMACHILARYTGRISMPVRSLFFLL